MNLSCACNHLLKINLQCAFGILIQIEHHKGRKARLTLRIFSTILTDSLAKYNYKKSYTKLEEKEISTLPAISHVTKRPTLASAFPKYQIKHSQARLESFQSYILCLYICLADRDVNNGQDVIWEEKWIINMRELKMVGWMMKNKTNAFKTSNLEHPHWVRFPQLGIKLDILSLMCNYMINYSHNESSSVFDVFRRASFIDYCELSFLVRKKWRIIFGGKNEVLRVHDVMLCSCAMNYSIFYMHLISSQHILLAAEVWPEKNPFKVTCMHARINFGAQNFTILCSNLKYHTKINRKQNLNLMISSHLRCEISPQLFKSYVFVLIKLPVLWEICFLDYLPEHVLIINEHTLRDMWERTTPQYFFETKKKENEFKVLWFLIITRHLNAAKIYLNNDFFMMFGLILSLNFFFFLSYRQARPSPFSFLSTSLSSFTYSSILSSTRFLSIKTLCKRRAVSFFTAVIHELAYFCQACQPELGPVCSVWKTTNPAPVTSDQQARARQDALNQTQKKGSAVCSHPPSPFFDYVVCINTRKRKRWINIVNQGMYITKNELGQVTEEGGEPGMLLIEAFARMVGKDRDWLSKSEWKTTARMEPLPRRTNFLKGTYKHSLIETHKRKLFSTGS
ncbi:hypothetical protein VP01_1813g1 [Puccinia sorghi]|uniref:Uncharacterized protein n=1 Tax=Puccinia sorghi TaxID=27349 RepID=A0A0L6VE43_9BASI|nr:hypothetical protein VP01_1813g1 [Puccinia sorghi]